MKATASSRKALHQIFCASCVLERVRMRKNVIKATSRPLVVKHGFFLDVINPWRSILLYLSACLRRFRTAQLHSSYEKLHVNILD